MGPMGSATWDVCVCTHCKISIIVLTIVLAFNAQYIYIAKISSKFTKTCSILDTKSKIV